VKIGISNNTAVAAGKIIKRKIGSSSSTSVAETKFKKTMKLAVAIAQQ
jgi:hypothetical protein